MVTNKTPKNAENFHCELCDFKCSKLSEWNRHISTAKHKMVTNGDKNGDKKRQKTPEHLTCECGKSYKHRQGLSRHKKKCRKTPEENILEEETNTPVNSNNEKKLLEIIEKQQQQINQLIPCVGNNNNNNTTNNFNVNFFLNNDYMVITWIN